MNILLVTPFSIAEIGGVTTFVTQLQEGVKGRGHKALLLVPGDGDRIAPVTNRGRSDVYCLYLRHMYVRNALLKGFVAFCVYLPLTLYRLRAFLKQERIRIVHVHFPTPVCLYFSVLRLLGPWKLVLTLHGSDVYALSKQTWLYRALLGVVFRSADCVVAATAHLIRTLKATYAAFRGRTRVIPNGNPLVTTAHGAALAEHVDLPERYILAVGNLIPRKGYDVLLRALALARDEGCDLNVVILGHGPEASNLAGLADELGVHDRVVFVGHVPHTQLVPFYLRATFFVHAAREEAQGLVLVEAMSCRTAVIAPRVLGIPELIRDGETGLLFEPGDARSLASALIKLETDTNLRDALAERAYVHVTQEHTWDRFIDRYIHTYEIVAQASADRGAAEVVTETKLAGDLQ